MNELNAPNRFRTSFEVVEQVGALEVDDACVV